MIVGLLNPDDALNQSANQALSSAQSRGPLLVCGLVYVELAAMPPHPEWTVDAFLAVTGIQVDWTMEEDIWRSAAHASHSWYQRKRAGAILPRRVAADFLIGAHAMHRGADLLTFDERTFRVAFPKLKVISF